MSGLSFVPICKSDYLMPGVVIDRVIDRVEAVVSSETLVLLRNRMDQGNIDRYDFMKTLKEIAGEDVVQNVLGELRVSIKYLLERFLDVQVKGFNLQTLMNISSDAVHMNLSKEMQSKVKQRVKELFDLYAKMEKFNIQFPEDVKCFITQEIMVDPVTAMDGHNYERQAILAHFWTSTMSPATNQELSSKDLRSNKGLMKRIEAYPDEMLKIAEESRAMGFAQRVQQEKDMLARTKEKMTALVSATLYPISVMPPPPPRPPPVNTRKRKLK